MRCVVQALEAILKTSKAVEKVKLTAFEDLSTSALQGEWDEIVDYAKLYLNIATEGNGVIWWKLFFTNLKGLGEYFRLS